MLGADALTYIKTNHTIALVSNVHEYHNMQVQYKVIVLMMQKK